MSHSLANSVRVFSGPSLTPDEVSGQLPWAICHPPAALGDIYQAVSKRPRAILLIDGYLDQQPAVWHKEILWALDNGIAVYGAASMGALRAVEMAPFGMRGIGSIFEAYRDGDFEDDDDVALLHGPQECAFAPITEAMVNVHATLDFAVRSDTLTVETVDGLRQAAKAINFRHRTWPRICSAATECFSVGPDLTVFRQWLEHNRVDQKRLDALQAVEHLRRCTGQDSPVDTPMRAGFERNVFWQNVIDVAEDRLIDLDDRAVLLRNTDDDETSLELHRLRALVRLLSLESPRMGDLAVSATGLSEQMQDFCDRYKLETTADVDAWLRNSRMNREELQRLLRENAMVEALLAVLGPRSVMSLTDEFRLSGRYLGLCQQKRDGSDD